MHWKGCIQKGGEADIEEPEESLPDTGDIFWDAEGAEDVIEEGLCSFGGCG